MVKAALMPFGERALTSSLRDRSGTATGSDRTCRLGLGAFDREGRRVRKDREEKRLRGIEIFLISSYHLCNVLYANADSNPELRRGSTSGRATCCASASAGQGTCRIAGQRWSGAGRAGAS